MSPIDTDELARTHYREIYELRLLIASLNNDVNAAHEAIRRVEKDKEKIQEMMDHLGWYRENLDCVKLVVEQSTWIKQTRHVVVWLASGVAGFILLWETLFPFLRKSG